MPTLPDDSQHVDDQRRERLAVNLFDLARVPAAVRPLLVSKHVDPRQHFRVGDGDAVAVPFVCDLLTAALVCDRLRADDARAGDRPTRCYLHRGRGWQRLPGAALLTVRLLGGAVGLNPVWFPPADEEREVTPPPARGPVQL